MSSCPNPYASPQYVSPARRASGTFGRIACAVGLAMAGIAIMAVAQFAISGGVDDVWGPIVLGVALGSSEFVAHQRPKSLGLVRRLLISTALLPLCLVLNSVLAHLIGWQQASYEDPYRTARLVSLLLMYAGAIVAVRKWFYMSNENP
jgi:hypothetical protein